MATSKKTGFAPGARQADQNRVWRRQMARLRTSRKNRPWNGMMPLMFHPMWWTLGASLAHRSQSWRRARPSTDGES